MDRLAALLTIVVAFAALALAAPIFAAPQDGTLATPPPATAPATQPSIEDPGAPPTSGQQWATVGGIAVLTGTIVELLKRYSGTWPVIQNTPTWMVSVAVAIVLVVIGKYVVHAIEGDLGEFIWNVVLAVVGATTGQAILTNMGATSKTYAKSH